MSVRRPGPVFINDVSALLERLAEPAGPAKAGARQPLASLRRLIPSPHTPEFSYVCSITPHPPSSPGADRRRYRFATLGADGGLGPSPGSRLRSRIWRKPAGARECLQWFTRPRSSGSTSSTWALCRILAPSFSSRSEPSGSRPVAALCPAEIDRAGTWLARLGRMAARRSSR